MKFIRRKIIFAFLLAASCGWLKAETISIVILTNAAPRVEFGAEKLAEALKAVKLDATIIHSEKEAGKSF